jgi:hypothetical protein
MISNIKGYDSWRGMKERCSNPNHKDYSIYGGKGISVCSTWVNSFETFLADMGVRPEGKTLDRIDSNKSYSSSNCRWADQTTQCRNQNIRKDNTSGCRGVHFRESRGLKWTARISYGGKRVHLGAFENKEEAIAARKEAELKYWS